MMLRPPQILPDQQGAAPQHQPHLPGLIPRPGGGGPRGIPFDGGQAVQRPPQLRPAQPLEQGAPRDQR